MVTTRTMIRLGVSGALASMLAVGGASAHAQSAPVTAAGASACMLANALPTCIDGGVAGALTALPGGTNGANRGGPLHVNGGHAVDVAAHHGRMLAR